MIIFNGTYPRPCHSRFPEFSAAGKNRLFQLRIIDMSDTDNIYFLKPFYVIATSRGPNQYRRSCLETVGRFVFDDFNLDLMKTIWIEADSQNPEQLQIASLTEDGVFETEVHYRIRWRRIQLRELSPILPFLSDLSGVRRVNSTENKNNFFPGSQ